MWIPNKTPPDVEKWALSIIEAARDAKTPEGHQLAISVRFIDSVTAQAVADCLNEKYPGVYSNAILIDVVH